jgi:hypothetical protein
MKLVTTEAVMTALCQHCDSHIEMCEECGMREIIESVPSAWISVKDRLPEESGYYIVYSPYQKVWFVRWSSVFKAWNCCDDSDEHRLDDITHWMPMPDAPEVEG